MHRLLQTLILAIFLVLLHAVWQPANAATSFCDGLKCEQCEVDLNTALATDFIATPYTFVCGHDGGRIYLLLLVGLGQPLYSPTTMGSIVVVPSLLTISPGRDYPS